MSFLYPLPKFNRSSLFVKHRCQGKLLPHQSRALEELLHWFDRDAATRNDIALVSIPTGSGKTGIIACLPYFLGSLGLESSNPENQPPEGNPLHRFEEPVLVIAPDLAIAKQLEKQLVITAEAGHKETFLIRREIVPDDPEHVAACLARSMKIDNTFQLRHPSYLNSSDHLVISNAQKFVGDDWESSLPDDLFKLVIVDEAHHHPATTWRRIIEKFEQHALVVFFTATPYRSDGQHVLGDPSKKLAFHLPLKDAVYNGIIRKTKFKELDGTDSLDGLELSEKSVSAENEDNRGRMVTILRKVKKLLEKKNQPERFQDSNAVPQMAMAIAKDIRRAKLLLELWKKISPEHENPDAAIYCSTKEHAKENEQTMKRLKKNELRLVIIVGMLLEGFDHPQVSIAAITYKIGSIVRFVQFVGRAQRIYRGPGSIGINDTAYIITHKEYEQKNNYDSFKMEKFIPNRAVVQPNDE